jgi:hypothetical protein
MAVEAQDRDRSRHHPPYPFFSEIGAMDGATTTNSDVDSAPFETEHGLPAALRNALDLAYAEYDREPAMFVDY